MENKHIQVVCPCCASELEVDVTVGAIRNCSPEDGGQQLKGARSKWSEALERVRNRPTSSAEKFEASVLLEKGRTRDLDDLLRRGNKQEQREEKATAPDDS